MNIETKIANLCTNHLLYLLGNCDRDKQVEVIKNCSFSIVLYCLDPDTTRYIADVSAIQAQYKKGLGILGCKGLNILIRPSF